MTHPGEQFYPEGVRWDAPIARGTLPELLAKAVSDFGDRGALEFRDRPISFNALAGLVDQ
ncbi:MAG: dicarboxylate--CoA ligase PimA, partial [Bradyrhizobium sp.]